MSSADANSVFTYRIDADDRIVAVSDNWDAFALANDGPLACAARVTGRDLFAFIGELEEHHVYRSILLRVRAGDGPLRCTFRCDSPDQKRLFAMEVRLVDHDVVFTNTLLVAEPVGKPGRLEELRERVQDMVRMCIYCRGILNGGQEWRSLGQGLRDLRLFEARRLPKISHGICPVCYAREHAEA